MSGINQEQKAAAAHKAGHAIVLAGPGTGKTSTLTARFNFLCHHGVAPESILVSTFTKKAAEELKSRIGKSAAKSNWIGTFHSICLRMLRRFSDEAGVRKNFKTLDPGEQKSMLTKAGVVWDSDDGDLTDIIGRWKDSLMSPDEASAEAARRGNVILRNAAEYYEIYETELAKRGDLDFADLVIKSLRLLESNATVREFFRTRIKHALVDEFQDVNKSQVLLLQAMASCGTQLWAVADDDQALYGWRGGNVRYTVRFNEYFKDARTYTLSTNYRCDPAIIAAANTVIGNNKDRVRKQLKPSKQHRKGNVVKVRGFRTEREEAEWIAATLQSYQKAGAALNDICLLMRTSSVTPIIQQTLEKQKIPFSLSGAQSFWDLPEVSAVADLLAAIEKDQIGRSGKFKGAADLVNTMKGSKPHQAAAAAGRLVGDQPPAGSTGERAALWADASEAAADFAKNFSTSEAFQSHINQMSGQIDTGDSDGVAITTIHSSKGLEWKHVIIAGCEATLMPHHRSEDKEEERRLFYVALTRSKGAVDATYSKNRFGKSQMPSPYLTEISKAPQGAVLWVGAEAEADIKPRTTAKVVAPKKPEPTSKDGMPKVYRRRGGRSLIPPDER